MNTTDNNALENNTANTAVSSGTNSDEITIIDLIMILWKGKYILIACTFLTTVAGIIYALLATEMFSSYSLFITKTGKQSVGNLSQLASLAGVNIGNNSEVDPADYLDKVIQDKDFLAMLYEKKWLFKGDSLPLEQILKIKIDTTVQNWKYVHFMNKIEAVRKGKILTLKKDPKTSLLTLSSIATDPQLTFDLNVFTLNYLRNYIRNSIKSQAKEKRIFIEERIVESKSELENSEDALAKFRGRNSMTNSPQMMLEEARLARQVAMNQEIYIQFKKQYELAKIEELDDQPLIQVIRGADVPIERIKPKRTMIVIISFICGFFIGAALVVIIQSIHTFSNYTGRKR